MNPCQQLSRNVARITYSQWNEKRRLIIRRLENTHKTQIHASIHEVTLVMVARVRACTVIQPALQDTQFHNTDQPSHVPAQTEVLTSTPKIATSDRGNVRLSGPVNLSRLLFGALRKHDIAYL